jgi:hypothetical protein
MIKININKIALTLTALAFFLCAILWNEKSRAATTGLTGKCGGVLSLKTAADGPLSNGQTSAVNSSFILDFDKNLASISKTDQTMISGADDIWVQKMYIDKTFTMVPDPDGFIGSYEVIININNVDFGANPKMRLIPVNSGNTMLIQGKNFGPNGVCQKI